MQRLLIGLAALAAFAFVVVSATVNSVFLSSLGRTELEAGLLAAVSIASDIAKVILPVVVARAIVLRAWTQAGTAGLFLTATIALSLASGLGFAAMTRGAVIAVRDGVAAQLVTLQDSVQRLDLQLAGLPAARPSSLIAIDLDAAALDRRWTVSKSCTAPQDRDGRQFCTEVLRLRSEQAAARERTMLASERAKLVQDIEVLRTKGHDTASDPQVAALAALSGLPDVTLRGIMTVMVVVVLELGSVALLLLVLGPTLAGWREPVAPPAPGSAAATIPLQPDLLHWEKQYRRANGIGTGSGTNDR